MRSARTWGLPVAALLTLLSAGEARALDCTPVKVSGTAQTLSPCIDSDNLWPHAGGGPYFAIGSTTTTAPGSISFGIVGSFFKQPIGVGVVSASTVRSSRFLVDDAFDATLLLGLGLTDRFELTLAAPATLYQDGQGLFGANSAATVLPRSAVRDVRFGLTVAMLSRPRTGEERGPALTGRLEFSAPTASDGALAGGATAVFLPSVAFSYRLGRVDIAAEAVARIRGEQTFANAVVGSQVGGALGASVDVLRDRWLSAGGEMFVLGTTSKQSPDPSATSGASAPPLVPAEWIAHVSSAHFFGGDVTVSLGGGSSIPFASSGGLTNPHYRLDFAVRYAPTGRDTDGDGVLDRDDRCPHEPGSRENGGCPDQDRDGDGVPDHRDKCPDQAGPASNDGCPGADSDGDGIPDELDKCPNEPEDFDGFQDHDGCPELDNDGDGIPDALDKCPNEPEDVDGYQDADGCPDPDNDGDGIPDALDLCPNEPEDFDGFQDHDGCPEPDNDQDGIADALDKCPDDAETIDGVQDADGCPEPGARSLVRWDGDGIALGTAPARFAPGRAEVPAPLALQLRMMAQLARGRAPLVAVIIEGYGDRAKDTSVRAMELAASRAQTAKEIFVAAGIPAAIITAAAGDAMAKRAPGAPAVDVTVPRRKRPSAPKPNQPKKSPR
jgi:hypothetical protein